MWVKMQWNISQTWPNQADFHSIVVQIATHKNALHSSWTSNFERVTVWAAIFSRIDRILQFVRVSAMSQIFIVSNKILFALTEGIRDLHNTAMFLPIFSLRKSETKLFCQSGTKWHSAESSPISWAEKKLSLSLLFCPMGRRADELLGDNRFHFWMQSLCRVIIRNDNSLQCLCQKKSNHKSDKILVLKLFFFCKVKIRNKTNKCSLSAKQISHLEARLFQFTI